MALSAGLGKVGGDVIRIGSALIVLQMTGDAGRAAQAEVVVNVTVGALTRGDGMSSSERESSCAVVEVCIQPCVDAVAGGAIGGEATGNVVGTDG